MQHVETDGDEQNAGQAHPCHRRERERKIAGGEDQPAARREAAFAQPRDEALCADRIQHPARRVGGDHRAGGRRTERKTLLQMHRYESDRTEHHRGLEKHGADDDADPGPREQAGHARNARADGDRGVAGRVPRDRVAAQLEQQQHTDDQIEHPENDEYRAPAEVLGQRAGDRLTEGGAENLPEQKARDRAWRSP